MREGNSGAPREGVPGECVPIWAQRHGQSTPEYLGDVVIEDLTGVLTRIQAKKGANGPQGPMTQFILAAATRRLDERLGTDFEGIANAEPVPRILSALIGHEPFVQDALGLSVNQMRRRWPMATDWYGDLIAYILRPQRHETNYALLVEELPQWEHLPLGEYIAALAEQQLRVSLTPELYRLSDTIRWLWPNHEAAKAAQRAEMTALLEVWRPLFVETFDRYGLQLRKEVDLTEVSWLANALISWEAHQRTVDPDFMRWHSPTGAQSSMGARSFMLFLQAALVDNSGRPLSIEDLYARNPTVVS